MVPTALKKGYLNFQHYVMPSVSKGDGAKGTKASHDAFQPADTIQVVVYICSHDHSINHAVTQSYHDFAGACCVRLQVTLQTSFHNKEMTVVQYMIHASSVADVSIGVYHCR